MEGLLVLLSYSETQGLFSLASMENTGPIPQYPDGLVTQPGL